MNVPCVLVLLCVMSDSRFRFEHAFIDLTLDGGHYAQTAAADIDRDGRPEFIVGRQYAEIYWYDFDPRSRTWTRYRLGTDSPSDVGACAIDVDGDGWIDVVTGGAWYRNSRDPRRKHFERFVFDEQLKVVHDVVPADIDGDGKLEIITMTDVNDLRSYRIPDDPTQPWIRHDIGAALHAGAAVGDINADGALDVVRGDVWFENVRGDGSRWVEHPIGPLLATGPFATGTRAVCHDINRDGRLDIVFTNAETKGAKIWWAENVDGRGREWRRHELPVSDDSPRGAYHSLAVVDFDGDGVEEIFTCEMEHVPGERPPRFFIWHNPDGRGRQWVEHVILDANLGGHEAVVADFDGDGRPDIVSKPWTASKTNAVEGRVHVDFLRNVSAKQEGK